MTRFDLLKQLDINLAAKIMFEFGTVFASVEELKENLVTEVTEAELHHPTSKMLRISSVWRIRQI